MEGQVGFLTGAWWKISLSLFAFTFSVQRVCHRQLVYTGSVMAALHRAVSRAAQTANLHLPLKVGKMLPSFRFWREALYSWDQHSSRGFSTVYVPLRLWCQAFKPCGSGCRLPLLQLPCLWLRYLPVVIPSIQRSHSWAQCCIFFTFLSLLSWYYSLERSRLKGIVYVHLFCCHLWFSS